MTFCQYFLFGINLVYLKDKNKQIKNIKRKKWEK